jgi:hypothetical protein
LPYFDFRKCFRMSGGSDFRFVRGDCLVNFAQSFKYTRAFTAFRCDFDGISTFGKDSTPVLKLRENIIHFNQERTCWD